MEVLLHKGCGRPESRTMTPVSYTHLAAREKEVIVERAVITVGAAQNLFLGEGRRQDYGMIRFDAEPFDVEESYMRLMMES